MAQNLVYTGMSSCCASRWAAAETYRENRLIPTCWTFADISLLWAVKRGFLYAGPDDVHGETNTRTTPSLFLNQLLEDDTLLQPRHTGLVDPKAAGAEKRNVKQKRQRTMRGSERNCY
jgi:hypothetical protein